MKRNASVVSGKRVTQTGDVKWRCAVIALFLTLPCVSAAQTQSRAGVIGLLTLPQLFGTACKEPPPRQLPLYTSPESADIVGWIRADKDPSSDADCYRVALNVHHRDGSVRALPMEEYEEEQPLAAIVVEARGRWLKLRLNDGAAWVEAPEPAAYFPLEQLLRRRPAFLTEAWDGKLAATAGEASGRVAVNPRRKYPSVRLVGSRAVRGTLWLRVELMSHTIYESNDPPRVIATGWVPAHDPAGEPVVWFHSRD